MSRDVKFHENEFFFAKLKDVNLGDDFSSSTQQPVEVVLEEDETHIVHTKTMVTINLLVMMSTTLLLNRLCSMISC